MHVIILDKRLERDSTAGEPVRVLVVEGSFEHQVSVYRRIFERLEERNAPPLVVDREPLPLISLVPPQPPRSNSRVPEFLQHSPFPRRGRR